MSAPLSILDYRQPVDFRMGDVLVRSWTILSRHFLTFAVLVGVAQLLPLVLSLYLLQSLGSAKRFDPSFTALVAGGGIGVIQFILSNFAQAIVIFAAFQDLRGRPVSAAESLQQGLARVFPAILAAILTVLLVVVGAMFCLVPGLVAWAAMSVVLPACVVERMGPIESMSRSADLTSGHRWPIALVALVWLIIAVVVSGLIGAIVPDANLMAAQILSWVWQVIAGSFTAVYTAILYHDLRAIREGIGIDEIASVFD